MERSNRQILKAHAQELRELAQELIGKQDSYGLTPILLEIIRVEKLIDGNSNTRSDNSNAGGDTD